ncbi:gluconokinase [Galbitalea sp. SE-J8]|uniref:gluconokinase n=1 Tax=Galbitalea sp. SE-J8 TaxID=3054952 RepID=UPI00259CF254|nr:gluconokinase [Galbitalea sp. SE-J8]MDM4762422.1 gluconokinase [Galbitalea sp. SE-J8]
MGVAGSGKSTLAATLAERLGWPFAEGDALHPEANVAKMAAGTPLTDEDRWPWLERVAAWIRQREEAGEPGVVTCSALKRAYRDVLRTPNSAFVYLHGPREVLAERLATRSGHFMPPSLLDSQLDTLEPLETDEVGIQVDVELEPEAAADLVIATLGLERSAGPVPAS